MAISALPSVTTWLIYFNKACAKTYTNFKEMWINIKIM